MVLISLIFPHDVAWIIDVLELKKFPYNRLFGLKQCLAERSIYEFQHLIHNLYNDWLQNALVNSTIHLYDRNVPTGHLTGMDGHLELGRQ
jgi:hypothetical protein